MGATTEDTHNACIVEGVQPLLAELRDAITVQLRGEQDSSRGALEVFIREVFQRSYGAEVRSFYPNLTAFTCGAGLRGVVGYRGGNTQPLFCEQYLDEPVECAIGTHLGEVVERRHTVEVGNLALGNFGDARWVIAAVTVLLHAAGYRWVVFTAVRSLVNAFERLGLKPLRIAVPDPARLPDGGRDWGRYYEAAPMVCAGDIAAGYEKLRTHVSQRQPRLHALLEEAIRLGTRTGLATGRLAREAV